MPLLALSSSGSVASVAVLDGGRVLALGEREAPLLQAERLLPLLQETLETAGVGPRDLTRCAVDIGPGSFTGIRVGLALVSGFAMARALPVDGVGSLDAVLASVDPGHEGAVLALLDARRGRAYAKLGGPRDTPRGDAAWLEVAGVRAWAEAHGAEGSLCAIGDAGVATAAGLVHRMSLACHYPRADWIGRLASMPGYRGAPTPAYLQPPDISTPRSAAAPR